jgi:hypothetical protein
MLIKLADKADFLMALNWSLQLCEDNFLSLEVPR